MAYLIINSIRYSYQSGLQGVITDFFSDEEKAAVTFCKEWLQGQEIFLVDTSGSTGSPKTIEIPRSWMEASAKATCSYLHLEKSDTALICLNPKYIAGKMMLVRAMITEMDAVIVRPEANPLDNLHHESCNFAALVPLQLQAILSKESTKNLLNKMKVVLVGGAPMSLSLKERCLDLEVPIYVTFGMTETVSHIALQRINGTDKESNFTALPNIQIKKDDRGCLQIKSLQTKGEWIITNDLVEILAENKFNWLGRIDLVINSGGVKIQIEKVEQLIENEFLKNGIKNKFVVSSIADEVLGEMVVLVLEGESQSDVKLNFNGLSKFEQPKMIRFVDKFPETASGKIDRLLIKKIIGNFTV